MGKIKVFILQTSMKLFLSPRILGLVLLISYASCVFPMNRRADLTNSLKRRRLEDDKTHASDPTTGKGKAAAAGSFKTSNGKTIEHGELSYVVPPTTKISQCEKDKQIPASAQQDPDNCADYVKKGWNGFMTDKAKQEKAYPDLSKFANDHKLAARFWGRDIEQNKEYAQDQTLPDYVYDIGLCTSRLWSQNLINNKIIMNKQITDYNDNTYTKCAKYDVLARSCLMKDEKIDTKTNSCYKYYAQMAVRVGQYKTMQDGSKRLQQVEAYDDETTGKMLKDGTQKTTRKGKYYRQSTDKLKKELDDKVACLNRVLNDAACFLFRNMMPAALQSEVQEITFLHKDKKECPKCPPCPACPGCKKCKRCECQRLTLWEKEALHKVIWKAKITETPIKTGVKCDLSAFASITKDMAEEAKTGQELIKQMQAKNAKRQRILEEEGEFFN